MLKLLWTLRDNISMKLSLAGLRSSLEPISDMLSEQYSDRLYSASPLAQQSVEVVQQWVEVASNSAGRVAFEIVILTDCTRHAFVFQISIYVRGLICE